tara:strand:+ start:336 stop:887 length:552 start_codon:yes stop_codon:yes gene_type:complete
MDNFDYKKYLAEGKLLKEEGFNEILGLFKSKPKLYEPDISDNYLNKYVFLNRDKKEKIKDGTYPPKVLLGINSIMVAIEEFLKTEILRNENPNIVFVIYPGGVQGGLTDDKVNLHITVGQRGKVNGSTVDPDETLQVIKIFIDNYLKKQKGIDVASEIVKRSFDTDKYKVTVPITFKEIKETK